MNCLLYSYLFSTAFVALHGEISFSNRRDLPAVHTPNELIVKKCEDFTITGDGTNSVWDKSAWIALTKLDSGGAVNRTRFKILYSQAGIYVLFEGTDDKITTQNFNDNDNIFTGDVFEVFFHPDPSVRVYYEYEVNALSKELTLSISSLKGFGYSSWIPRRNGVRKEVRVTGGLPDIDSRIKAWTAEIFFPYGALGLLPNVPPASGSTWNANFCRLDYDTGKMIKWSWTPTIKTSFHELEEFHTIRFE